MIKNIQNFICYLFISIQNIKRTEHPAFLVSKKNRQDSNRFNGWVKLISAQIKKSLEKFLEWLPLEGKSFQKVCLNFPGLLLGLNPGDYPGDSRSGKYLSLFFWPSCFDSFLSTRLFTLFKIYYYLKMILIH